MFTKHGGIISVSLIGIFTVGFLWLTYFISLQDSRALSVETHKSQGPTIVR